MKEETAGLIVGDLYGAWLLVFGFPLLLINGEYSHTFFSMLTSNEWVRSRFTKEKATDATKMHVHTMRRA